MQESGTIDKLKNLYFKILWMKWYFQLKIKKMIHEKQIKAK